MNNLVESKNEVSQMNERTITTIQNIKDLQELEKTLYAQLENSASSSNPPSLEQQEKAIQRINELSKMRATLFGNLQDSYSMNQYQVAQTRNNLVDELTNVKIIEGELNNSKKQMNALKKEKINNLRMVEINTYFGKRYEAHANIMKIIIFACIPIIIITVLNKKNIISENITNALVAIIIVIFIITMWYKITDILFRDNMDFDQIKFPFNPKNVDLDNSDSSNIVNLPDPLDMGIECVGDSCCSDNMVYDSDNNVCVFKKTDTSSDSNTENFTNSDTSMMTKDAFTSMWNDTIKLKENSKISPYSDSNFNYAKI